MSLNAIDPNDWPACCCPWLKCEVCFTASIKERSDPEENRRFLATVSKKMDSETGWMRSII